MSGGPLQRPALAAGCEAGSWPVTFQDGQGHTDFKGWGGQGSAPSLLKARVTGKPVS